MSGIDGACHGTERGKRKNRNHNGVNCLQGHVSSGIADIVRIRSYHPSSRFAPRPDHFMDDTERLFGVAAVGPDIQTLDCPPPAPPPPPCVPWEPQNQSIRYNQLIPNHFTDCYGSIAGAGIGCPRSMRKRSTRLLVLGPGNCRAIGWGRKCPRRTSDSSQLSFFAGVN